jgi:hypothetical protein
LDSVQGEDIEKSEEEFKKLLRRQSTTPLMRRRRGPVVILEMLARNRNEDPITLDQSCPKLQL